MQVAYSGKWWLQFGKLFPIKSSSRSNRCIDGRWWSVARRYSAQLFPRLARNVTAPRDPHRRGQVLPFRAEARVTDPGEPSPGDLFTSLWNALADMLGTAAAAALLRRAVQRALPRFPELGELAITRASLEYRYTLPAAWKASAPPRALCELVGELWPLLVDLTGPVVVERLLRIPELVAAGIVPPRSEESS